MSINSPVRSEWTVRSLLLFSLAAVGCGTSNPAPVPAPAPEEPVVVSADHLRQLLFAFADDSMQGREAGEQGNYMGTTFLASQARLYGLEPAGEDGTYFQTIPLRVRKVFVNVSVAGEDLQLGTDILPIPPIQSIPAGMAGAVDGVSVVYGGQAGGADEIAADQGLGKVVVLAAAAGPNGPAFSVARPSLQKFAKAAAIVIVNLDYAPPGVVGFLTSSRPYLADDDSDAETHPLLMVVTGRVGELLMGGSLDSIQPGAEGRPLHGSFGFTEEEPNAPARNVVAVLRGNDPALSSEYVAVSAHNDHVGMTSSAVDHDSLRAYLEVVRPGGADDPRRDATVEEQEQIQEILSALRQRRAARGDSIQNGADDDGSGSMAVLEVARAMAAAPERPRRSILFVWHTAEELGMVGARYYTDHPTVSRDAIVADINADMIGRGRANDVEGGGPGYLQLIGSRRLSTELGDMVEAVNTDENHGFTFDYTYDADGHPDNYYCRSDHYMYARYGIPVVFMSTGGHRDYHQLTDEPQYIDYDKLAQVAGFMQALAMRVANLDHRVVVDKPVPDINAPCRQ